MPVTEMQITVVHHPQAAECQTRNGTRNRENETGDWLYLRSNRTFMLKKMDRQ